jgi:hypothetical protein
MAKTPEEIKERLSNAKEKVLTTKDALKAFVKENGLKKGEDHSKNEDSKIAKKFVKLTQDVADAEARVEKYQELLKGSKGAAKKSSGGGAKTTYVYPAGVETAEDKKKFRAETRSKCKKLGITTEEYMTAPSKYDKMAKAASKAAPKEEAAKPSKKKAAKEEVKPAKKKKTPKPEVEEEEATDGGED